MVEKQRRFVQRRSLKLLPVLAMLLLVVETARAVPTYEYVGSWDINSGPLMRLSPLAYSAVGAAELLFGAGDYVISTVDADPTHIDFQAWYKIVGFGQAKFSEDYFRGTEGITYYRDVFGSDPNLNTVSAYVHDGYVSKINYAFRIVDSGPRTSVPEGGITAALLAVSLAGIKLLRLKWA